MKRAAIPESPGDEDDDDLVDDDEDDDDIDDDEDEELKVSARLHCGRDA
jgi:hypothetical protein